MRAETPLIKQMPIVPDALIAASIAMGCVLFLHARLREIFGGNDRERMEYVGGDKTIVREVDAESPIFIVKTADGYLRREFRRRGDTSMVEDIRESARCPRTQGHAEA